MATNSKARLSTEDLQKAKDAITMLSSLITPESSKPKESTLVSGTDRWKDSDSNSAATSSASARAAHKGKGKEKGKDKGLLQAADNALHALKGMRRGLAGDNKRKLKDELLQSFNPKKKKKCAWKHRFVCLAYFDQPKIPTTDGDKDELIKADLGEKVIEFSSLDTNADDISEHFYSAFPKLKEGGGYELCRCLANSRTLEVLTTVTCSSLYYLKERVGNSRTYIRPLQRDLDLSEVYGLPVGPEEECLTCGLKLPLDEIKSHARKCEKELGDLSPVNKPIHSRSPSPLYRSPSSLSRSPSPFHSRSPSPFHSRSPSPLPPPVLPPPVLPSMSFASHASTSSRSLDTDVVYVGTTGTNSVEESSIENEFLTAAVKQSMEDLSSSITPSTEAETNDDDLATEVRLLQRQVDKKNVLCLVIRRDFIIPDAMREARKKKFDPYKNIKITFTGEGAIDNGGPRREFFRLLAIKGSDQYFVGGESSKYFSNDVSALQNMEFFYLGQYTAMSIAQGGCGFPFLAKAVYQYISSGKITNVEVDIDLTEGFLKFALKKLKDSDNDAELQATLAIDEVSDLLLQCGYRRSISCLRIHDQREILAVLTDYHLMVKVKSAMDQYMDGLKVFNLLTKIQANPETWRPMFTRQSQQLDPETFKAHFTVLYAAKGTNIRPGQEETYIHFVDFLDECFDDDTGCSLEDILVFCSGASQVPPLGFDKSLTITFEYQGILATASTCSLQLRLPVNHGSNYSAFRDAMILCIKGNDGFGGV